MRARVFFFSFMLLKNLANSPNKQLAKSFEFTLEKTKTKSQNYCPNSNKICPKNGHGWVLLKTHFLHVNE